MPFFFSIPSRCRPCRGLEYFVSEKLDGVPGRWTGEHLETRNGHRISAPAWFTAGWPEMPMDGELWIAGGRFEEVSGIVRRQAPADAEWRRVKFMVFDLPAHPGTFAERVAAMQALRDVPPWLVVIDQFRVADARELVAGEGFPGKPCNANRGRERMPWTSREIRASWRAGVRSTMPCPARLS